MGPRSALHTDRALADVDVIERLNLGWGRRLPMILQTEAAECGLACLAMVASHFGYQVDISDLRRRHGFSLKGATLKDLVSVADQIGLASRAVRLELEELGRLKLPCILHWDLNHFVVLKAVGRNTIVIHDPSVGMRRLPMRELSRHFTGIALELTPTGGFEPAAAPPRVRIGALLGKLTGIWRALGHLLSLALAIELMALLSPLFLSWVVDHALVGADRDLLTTLVLGFALLLVIQTAIGVMRSWMIMALGASLKVQARANLFTHLIRLPSSYFETRHMADVMSRFGSQETILQAITTELVVGVLDGVTCILTLTLMFVFAPTLALIVLAGAILYALLRWLMYARLRQASSEAIIWAARRDSHFLESLRGITAIKLFGAQDDRRAHWLTLLVETVNRQLTKQKLNLLFRTANTLVLGGLGLVVIWLGALEVLAEAFTVGMLLAFLAYKDLFVRRISAMIDRVVDLTMLRLHAERLGDIALTMPEARDTGVARPMPRNPVSVEARNLRFRYSPNDRWVVDGVSFRIEAGESVAIAGPSGCGKSTLLKILAGLHQPEDGELLIDGEPLAIVGIERYRSMIGVVMQDDQLFAGSVADNISFFAPEPDHDRIETCARQAAIHDDIQAMPMGYGTLIGDMGTVLSGGQKQRVLIARALYRQPRLLLLDEATSHLDVERESSVNRAVGAINVTRIVVAHRPETISASGRVIRLERGRVVEHRAEIGADGSEVPQLAKPS